MYDTDVEYAARLGNMPARVVYLCFRLNGYGRLESYRRLRYWQRMAAVVKP